MPVLKPAALALALALCACQALQSTDVQTEAFEPSRDFESYYRLRTYFERPLSAYDTSTYLAAHPQVSLMVWDPTAGYDCGAWVPNEAVPPSAFLWTKTQRRETWDEAIRERLDAGRVEAGDDVFQVMEARGAPQRIVWGDALDVLLYRDDTAVVLEDGQLVEVLPCVDGWRIALFNGLGGGTTRVPGQDQIFAMLGLPEPRETRQAPSRANQ